MQFGNLEELQLNLKAKFHSFVEPKSGVAVSFKRDGVNFVFNDNATIKVFT